MINSSSELIFLKTGVELSNAIEESISDTIQFMRGRLNAHLASKDITAGVKGINLGFIKYFDDVPTSIVFDEGMIEAWYEYVLNSKSEMSKDKFRDVIGRVDESDLREWSKSLTTRMKGSLQIALLFLYMKKAVLLTYKFTRIRVSWLENSQMDVPCYTENMRFLRSFDKYTDVNGTQFLKQEKKKTLEQLYGQGMKMLVSSTWYRPEDITQDDLLAWRGAQAHCQRSSSILNIAPLPLKNLVAIFSEMYPERFSITPDIWTRVALPGGASLMDIKHRLKTLVHRENGALEVCKSIIDDSSISDASFNCVTIEQYDLPEVFYELGVNIQEAYKSWISAQQSFLEYAGYERDNALKTSLGRFNIYLIVYLPLWMHQNPSASKSLYPTHPNEFRAGVHFSKASPISKDTRPLTYMEFHSECDLHESWSGINQIKLFFDYLVHFNDSLPNWKGVKQPVYRNDMPKSKKYSSVQKNIFSKKLLSLFIRFLYGLEELQVNLQENYTFSKAEINNISKGKSELDSQLLNSEGFGFTPLVYHDNTYYKISQIHTGFMSFVEFMGQDIYFPGLLRHAITMLETGLRGQAIQWLDVGSYDEGVDRDEMHLQDLNSLWVNTDKTKIKGFYSLISNRVIKLLDRQRLWRDQLSQKGATGFNTSVYYEGRSGSKWGLIKPLFSSNLNTGAPFSDTRYSKSWTSLCFSFQVWLQQHDIDDMRLVSYVPIPRSKSKKFFKWEEWEDGLNEQQVVELSADEAIARWDWSENTIGGALCPVNLRTYITPHGARASFVSSMITVLPAEYIGAYLTGQKIPTIYYYAKPDDDYLRKLKLTQQEQLISIFEGKVLSDEDTNEALGASNILINNILTAIRSNDDINQVIQEHGLISLTVTEGNSSFRKTGVEIIASNKASSIGKADTHLCPVNFECPKEVLKSLKAQRRCSLCPYAIFPVNLLPRISARRHQVMELIASTRRKLERYLDEVNVSEKEVEDLDEKLNFMAEEAIGWRVVEESLWHLIEQRRKGLTTQSQIIREPEIVTSHIERVSVKEGSNEEFIRRLQEITIFPSTETPEMMSKVDQARRLLLAQNGELYKALMAPPPHSPAKELVGLIKNTIEMRNLNINEVLDLLSLNQEQWENELLNNKDQQNNLMLTGM